MARLRQSPRAQPRSRRDAFRACQGPTDIGNIALRTQRHELAHYYNLPASYRMVDVPMPCSAIEFSRLRSLEPPPRKRTAVAELLLIRTALEHAKFSANKSSHRVRVKELGNEGQAARQSRAVHVGPLRSRNLTGISRDNAPRDDSQSLMKMSYGLQPGNHQTCRSQTPCTWLALWVAMSGSAAVRKDPWELDTGPIAWDGSTLGKNEEANLRGHRVTQRPAYI